MKGVPESYRGSGNLLPLPVYVMCDIMYVSRPWVLSHRAGLGTGTNSRQMMPMYVEFYDAMVNLLGIPFLTYLLTVLVRLTDFPSPISKDHF